MKFRIALGLMVALAAGTAGAADKKSQSRGGPTASPPVASVDGLPIGNIPRQDLPPGKCAAFLWTKGPSQALIAMISGDPAFIRYAPGGVVTDLARTAIGGEGRFGVNAQSSYRSQDASIDADLTIEDRGDIHDGAAIPSGTLSISRAGADTVVVPVAGLIGCG